MLRHGLAQGHHVLAVVEGRSQAAQLLAIEPLRQGVEQVALLVRRQAVGAADAIGVHVVGQFLQVGVAQARGHFVALGGRQVLEVLNGFLQVPVAVEPEKPIVVGALLDVAGDGCDVGHGVTSFS